MSMIKRAMEDVAQALVDNGVMGEASASMFVFDPETPMILSGVQRAKIIELMLMWKANSYQLGTLKEWARQVSERKDVPSGIRSAARGLAI